MNEFYQGVYGVFLNVLSHNKLRMNFLVKKKASALIFKEN
jgi:hypothetical protein